MQTITQYLRSKGLASNRGIREQGVQKLTRLEIVNVSEELNDICLKMSEKQRNVPFKHFASMALGGSREECAHLRCRMNKLDELSRFAVMYSDRVLIRSFISDCSEANDSGNLGPKFFDDLQLLWHIKPLIEAGDVSLVPSFGCLCHKCICEDNNLDSKNINILLRKLENEYLDNTSLAVVRGCDNKISVIQRGSELYFPHGFLARQVDGLPSSLKKRPRVLNSLMRNGMIEPSLTLQREISEHKRMASIVIRNILYGLVAADSHAAPFVTHNPLHISCLNELAGSSEIADRNNIAFETLTSEVPFLPDISIRNLLRLRSREKESFILYRAALNKAIDEFRSGGDSFTKHDAKQLYGDVLAPELARMDRKVKQASKDLRTTARRAVAGTVGAISFGLCTGLVSAETSPTAIGIGAGIGLAKVASDIVKVMSAGDGKKSVANDDMYFLWKTKQLKK